MSEFYRIFEEHIILLSFKLFKSIKNEGDGKLKMNSKENFLSGPQDPFHIYKSLAIMTTSLNSGSESLPWLGACARVQSDHSNIVSFQFSKEPRRN